MDTYFASAERSDSAQLKEEIQIVSQSPVMSGLLNLVSGLLAVVNENRQIVAVNEAIMEMLGIDDPHEALGLRPGQVLKCVYAEDEPAGCGTTKMCSTCGAAIAMVASLGEDRPIERKCVLKANKAGRILNLTLNVQSNPIRIYNHRFLLLFLQDITLEQERACLERVFFHDINNMLQILINASVMLENESPSEHIKRIQNIAQRLHRELEIQRALCQSEAYSYRPMWNETSTAQILRELETYFVHHPAVESKRLEIIDVRSDLLIKTDTALLSRVLCNMVINALEATDPGGVVRVSLQQNPQDLVFSVWNERKIPDEAVNRIFQRNFSTKQETGRGLGTYSMKLFGENILGGKVDFTTSEQKGTFFHLTLPLA